MTAKQFGGCPLCTPSTETVLWRNEKLRVIRVADTDYPAFCRVIWNGHVKEMTDLAVADREYFMAVVFAVEQVLRDMLGPDKINLASLGNQVPHLHWHVIPRFAGDAHFPDPVWAGRHRAGVPHPVEGDVLVRRMREILDSMA